KTLAELERLALETNSSVWSAMSAAIEQNLLPPRACTALQGFKQLIDDARAMLLGNFAEKLSEDAAAPAEAESETAAADSSESEADDTSFAFGANDDDQQSLFAAGPENEPIDSAPLNQASEEPPPEGFRSPGGPATIPEVIKFLIDRSGYVKQLEDEATPEA